MLLGLWATRMGQTGSLRVVVSTPFPSFSAGVDTSRSASWEDHERRRESPEDPEHCGRFGKVRLLLRPVPEEQHIRRSQP
jgi:hypothetical protein